MHAEPLIAFAVDKHEPPGLEIRVNFGIFAGRDVTPAELDELAALLLPEVGEVSIVSEERHEIGPQTEATLHQVRIDVDDGRLPPADERDVFTARLVALADMWARECIADRHGQEAAL